MLACTEAIIIAMLTPLQLIWLGATTRTVLVPGCGGLGVMGVYGGDACPAPRAGVHSEGLAASRTPLYLGYGGERWPEAAVRHGATTRRRGPVRKSCGIFVASTDSRTSPRYGRIARAHDHAHGMVPVHASNRSAPGPLLDPASLVLKSRPAFPRS